MRHAAWFFRSDEPRAVPRPDRSPPRGRPQAGEHRAGVPSPRDRLALAQAEGNEALGHRRRVNQRCVLTALCDVHLVVEGQPAHCREEGAYPGVRRVAHCVHHRNARGEVLPDRRHKEADERARVPRQRPKKRLPEAHSGGNIGKRDFVPPREAEHR